MHDTQSLEIVTYSTLDREYYVRLHQQDRSAPSMAALPEDLINETEALLAWCERHHIAIGDDHSTAAYLREETRRYHNPN